MNILSFDIEEWYVNQQKGGPAERYIEYDHYLDAILDILDEQHFKATFFCVGEIGRLFPEVIHKIQRRGHEVGCHSNQHTWLNKMTEAEARKDTHAAISSLEQCMGQKVLSYRAPAFSIGESNKWMFEILAENGIERDASVFPVARDFGGFPNFEHKTPCVVEYKGISIKEFPVCTAKILGMEFAYSGGGYFRFFPLSFVEREMNKASYTMCYFHIGDLIPETRRMQSREEYERYFRQKGTLMNRSKRFVKGNLGKKGAFDKMKRLVSSHDFLSLDAADKAIDWEQKSVIGL